jgi:hypothetical protein
MAMQTFASICIQTILQKKHKVKNAAATNMNGISPQTVAGKLQNRYNDHLETHRRRKERETVDAKNSQVRPADRPGPDPGSAGPRDPGFSTAGRCASRHQAWTG